MYKTLPLVVILILSLKGFAQDKSYYESSTKISISQLKSIFEQINKQRTRQSPSKERPIQDKDDIKIFLEEIRKDASITIDYSIRGWLKDNLDLTDKTSAIIFIQHPVDAKLLYVFEETPDEKKTQVGDAYKQICNKLSGRKMFLEVLLEKRKTIQSSLQNDPSDETKGFDVKKITDLKILDELNKIDEALKKTNDEIDILNKDFEKAKLDFEKYSNQIIENKEKVESFILSKEKKKWSDYLLRKDEVLIVILGGKEDLANAKIKIDNKPSSFEQSFNDLTGLAKSLGIVSGSNFLFDESSDCSNPPDPKNQEIPVKFLLTKENKLKSPSTLEIADEKSKLDLKIENHEKAFLGFKVGVSAANIERKQFSLNTNNELSIKLDSTKQTEWKSNLMVMLDIYPFGRDIDRLEPLWKKNKEIGWLDANRIGVVLGIKLSKDPLETSFLGLSYAISKELSLNGGFAFNATPKNVDKLPVGVNATLDYLKDNAKRELKTTYYFGISLSPAAMGKTLGIIK